MTVLMKNSYIEAWLYVIDWRVRPLSTCNKVEQCLHLPHHHLDHHLQVLPLQVHHQRQKVEELF